MKINEEELAKIVKFKIGDSVIVKIWGLLTLVEILGGYYCETRMEWRYTVKERNGIFCRVRGANEITKVRSSN